jgi:hypothetical protein
MKSFRTYLENNYHKLLERRLEWFDSMKDLIFNLRKNFPEESLTWDSNSRNLGQIYDVFGVQLQIIRYNIFYGICIVKNLDTGQFAKIRLSELQKLGQQL